MNVKWAELNGYDAPYSISSRGEIIKGAYVDVNGKKRRSIKLKNNYTHGRATVRLLKDSKRVCYSVSHLVVFVFNREAVTGRIFISHLDGNIENCDLSNLSIHRYRERTIPMGMARAKKIFLWREASPYNITRYESIEDASRQLGLSHTLISHALNKDRGKAGVGQGKRDGNGLDGCYDKWGI